MNKNVYILLGMLTLGLGLVLAGANIVLGDLNQDEGWYLYAAGMVRRGFIPYRDFAFTQTPVLPLVYALADPLVKSYGLLGGRLFTAACGFLAALSASWYAWRIAPALRKETLLLCLMLGLGNVYQSYFTAIVKTYALCALFISLGFVALTFVNLKKGLCAAALAGALLGLATGTRLTAVVTLPITFGWLIWHRHGFKPFAWFAFAVGAGLAGIAVFLPLFIMAPGPFWFCNVTYHSVRNVGGLLKLLVYKAGFLSRLAQAYLVPLALLAFVLAAWWITLSRKPLANRWLTVSWLSVLAVSLAHGLAAFPYEDYQVIIYPLFAAALATALTGLVKAAAPGNTDTAVCGLLVAVFLCVTLASFSSPINQDWMIIGRDRIWWRMKSKPALVKLREAAALLRKRAGEQPVVLTQDTYLAVEAGLRVPRGMEMGPFCYYPNMPREKADALHVMNREKMLDLLWHTDIAVAACSEYAFCIASPEIVELPQAEQELLRDALKQRYRVFAETPYFGQGHTRLQYFILDESH